VYEEQVTRNPAPHPPISPISLILRGQKGLFASRGNFKMAPIGVWNQSSLHENAIVRSVSAIPFLVLLVWAYTSLGGLSIKPYLESIALSGRLRFGTISTPVLTKFLDIQFVDDFWRSRTIAYAPSTLGADPVSWFQNFNFLVDYGLMYCIWLLESARKSNEYSPVRL